MNWWVLVYNFVVPFCEVREIGVKFKPKFISLNILGIPKVELGLGPKSLRCRAFYGNKGPCEVKPTQSGIRFRAKKFEV